MPSRERREEPPKRRGRPATTPEGREHELVNKALNLAEKQIESGTASSQVITHFLKAGSLREQLEQQRIQYENELLQVKKEQIESQSRIEELYVNAIKAMRRYQPSDDEEPEDEPE